jgi:hypothetical protein
MFFLGELGQQQKTANGTNTPSFRKVGFSQMYEKYIVRNFIA